LTRPRSSALAGGERRQIALNGEPVEYRFTRTRRRSIGLEIGLDGLTVRSPLRVPVHEVDALLVERADWVLSALERWHARRREVLPREWVDGAPILYRGDLLALDLNPARERSIAPDLFHLRIRHPAPGDAVAIARFVGGWLREETMRTLAPQAAVLATRLGLAPPPLKITNARSEWGSCTRAGVVRLNWRLVHLPAALAVYVVAHEVAHLAEMNHSPRFWAKVEALYPGHRDARRALGEWTAVLES